MKDIILFGGTFNPPHKAHKEIVEKVAQQFNALKIIIVPCNIQPLKGDCHVDAVHRYNMLKLMFNSIDVIISDYEIKKGGFSYSIDTIKYFYKQYQQKIYFVMGFDSFLTFNKWKDSNLIMKYANLIIFSRDEKRISNSENIIFLDFNNRASSTFIRENFYIKKQEMLNYLELDVYNYILKNNLYAECNNGK